MSASLKLEKVTAGVVGVLILLRITGYNEPFGLGGCRDRLCMGDIHASG